MSDEQKPAEVGIEPTIRIINRAHVGFRRGGVAHPADATYPATEFTAEQILAFDAEPMLTVILPPEGEEALVALKSRKARK